MKARFRRVAVFAGAAALAGGVGIGVASPGGDPASSRAAAVARPAGGPGRMDVSALAERLGVSQARLEAALRAARESGDPGDRDAMAAALASALGLSSEKVSEALESLRPPGSPPPGGLPPSGTGGSTTGATAA
jgi:hypothetical protein